MTIPTNRLTLVPTPAPSTARIFTMVPVEAFPPNGQIRSIPAGQIGSEASPRVKPSKPREHPVAQDQSTGPVEPAREPIAGSTPT